MTTYTLTQDMTLDEAFLASGCAHGGSLTIQGSRKYTLTHGRPPLKHLSLVECKLKADNDTFGFYHGHPGLDTVVQLASCLIEGSGQSKVAPAFKSVKLELIDGCLWRDTTGPIGDVAYVNCSTFENMNIVLTSVGSLDNCRFNNCGAVLVGSGADYDVGPAKYMNLSQVRSWESSFLRFAPTKPQRAQLTQLRMGFDGSLYLHGNLESVFMHDCFALNEVIIDPDTLPELQETGPKPYQFQDCDFGDLILCDTVPDFAERYCTFRNCTVSHDSTTCPDGCVRREYPL
jgi:hypothetical protein